jgi:hypothetical protein
VAPYFASREDVPGRIGKAAVVDSRVPEQYGGENDLDFLDGPRHIKCRESADLTSLERNYVG